MSEAHVIGDPLCSLGVPRSQHSHPHECNFDLPAAARAPHLAPEITAVITTWLEENSMPAHNGAVYDPDVDGNDFSEVGVDGSLDIGELAIRIQATERERCVKIADGIRVAAGRLRRGYGHLHPGIDNFADSFEYEARRIRSGE